MNFGKSRSRRQSGNAMIYILLALGLLALLTASLMSQDSTGGDDISADKVQFQTTQMLSYAAAAQNVIDQMVGTGADPGGIDFAFPNATSFDIAPYKNKLFHPQGGGLNYKTATIPPFVTSSSGTTEGWYVTLRNVEWTPTTAADIVISAYNIPLEICQAINKKLTGSATVPALTVNSTRIYFTNFNASNLTSAACPGCVGYPTLCVANFGGTGNPTLYSIINAR